MNIRLETAVELESVILYINNGEYMELCDSTKLNKSAKIWHVYGSDTSLYGFENIR